MEPDYKLRYKEHQRTARMELDYKLRYKVHQRTARMEPDYKLRYKVHKRTTVPDFRPRSKTQHIHLMFRLLRKHKRALRLRTPSSQ